MKKNAGLRTNPSGKSPKGEPSAPSRAQTSQVKPVRIVVADDHPMTRAGVVQLINAEPDLQVCSEAGSSAEAFNAVARYHPDLLLTDMTMPGRSGMEFIKDLLGPYPKLPILILSLHDEVVYAERALRAGAKGYIMKEAGGELLLTAIRRVLNGQVYLSDEMSVKVVNNLSGSKPRSHSPIEKLTDREFQVLELIGNGKGCRDIADQLHLSPKTVDVHRARIKEKLELKDATALVRYAVRWVETISPSGL